MNDGDADGDGVPDWADGFDKFGQQSADASGVFTPLELTLPAGIDPAVAMVMFGYSANDPAAVTRGGNAIDGHTYWPADQYRPLRLWTKDGPAGRGMHSVNVGGDYIPRNEPIALSRLMGTGNTVTLYIEAVNATGIKGT